MKSMVKAAKSASNPRSTVPVYADIMIVAENGKITVTGDDGELRVTVSSEAETDGRTDVLADAESFSAVTDRMPGETVSIETSDDGKSIIIRSGKARFTLPAAGTSDRFPAPAQQTQNAVLVFPEGVLQDAVNAVKFCASTAGNSPLMGGINLTADGGRTVFTALDGYRVGSADAAGVTATGRVNITVPLKSMTAAAAMMKGDVNMTVGVTSAVFTDGSTEVSTRLLDGDYYNIASMLSLKTGTEVTADRAELAGAVGRSAVIVPAGSAVPLIMSFADGNGVMNISAKSAAGDMNEDVAAEVRGAGEEFVIGFNPKFLGELFGALKDGKVTLGFSGPKAPMSVRGDGYVYLVLPVNIIR